MLRRYEFTAPPLVHLPRRGIAYSKLVVENFTNPKNVGSLEESDPDVGTGSSEQTCGDTMKLQIKVNPESEVIEDVKFKTFGCAAAVASGSVFTQWIKGKSIEDAKKITNRQIAEHLELPKFKIHCSVLGSTAFASAVADYRKKKQKK